MSFPLSIFSSNSVDKERKLFIKLKKGLIGYLKNWKKFRIVRYVIEDLFKVAKSMGLRSLYGYGEICL